LESALDLITTHNAINCGNISCVCIHLPPGHFILKQPWFLNVNLTLTGQNEGSLHQSVIQCGYNDEQGPYIADKLKYTLFIENVKLVRFEFLHFKNCPQPLRIELGYNVSIINCVFTNFSEAALDIYNSAHVQIINSNFSNNSGNGSVHLPFRGNTGAVAIGYNNNPITTDSPTILVENCLFTSNQAISRSSYTADYAVFNRIFTGRGGALGLLINESSNNLTAVIKSCQFINNFAVSFGGGVYVVLDGKDTQHRVTVSNCWFVNNTGTLGAGGILITYFTNGKHSFPMTARIQNCSFFGNQGKYGGATYVFPASLLGGDGNVAYIEDSIYVNNEAHSFGGAIAASTPPIYRSREILPLYHIVNW